MYLLLPTYYMVQCWNLVTLVLGVFRNFGRKVQHGPNGPILWKYAKCISSYRLHGTMLKLCCNSTVVEVTSDCSAILGPWSNKGHRVHFVKLYAKCISTYRLNNTMLKLFSGILVPRSNMDQMCPFCENMLNVSPHTDCMVQCWNFVAIVLW